MTLLAKWRLALYLACDSGLTRADIVIGLLLLDLFNEAQGYAWPSVDWLAKATGVDRSTATRSVSRLTGLGYFQRTSGGGRGRANRYRPCFRTAENRRVDATNSAEKQARGRTETGASVRDNRRMDAPKQGRRGAPRPIKTKFTNPLSERGARALGEDFWLAEPGKGEIEQPQHHHGDRPQRQPKSGRHEARMAEGASSSGGDLRQWQPSPETVAWASEHAASVPDPAGPVIVESFRNHYLSRGTVFHDLDAAFRKWLLIEARILAGASTNRRHGRSRILDRAMRAAEAAVHRGGRDQ